MEQIKICLAELQEAMLENEELKAQEIEIAEKRKASHYKVVKARQRLDSIMHNVV